MQLVAFEEANNSLASEGSIFSEKQNYKIFLHVAVNPYVPIFQDLDTHTHK